MATTWTVGGRTWELSRRGVESNYFAELEELRRARDGRLTRGEREHGFTEADLREGIPRLEKSVARFAAILKCIDAGVPEVTPDALREIGGLDG